MVVSRMNDRTGSESDSRSALRDARHVEHEPDSDGRSSEIEQLKLSLQSAHEIADQERAITAQKEEQIQALQASLDKEKQKYICMQNVFNSIQSA